MSNQSPIDAFEPTIVHEPKAESPTRATATGVSKAEVGFVEGTGPRLSDETALLVRRRMGAAALILSIMLAIALVRNAFLAGHPLLGFRVAILVAMIASYAALRSRFTLTLKQLRCLEPIVFGGLIAQVVVMVGVMYQGYAATNDVATVVSVRHLSSAVISVLILIYGMLMPNTWKRAAFVLLPVACVPYALDFFMQWRNEDVAAAFAGDRFGMPVPLPWIAALAAIYGTYLIHGIRREAFKARQLDLSPRRSTATMLSVRTVPAVFK